MKNYPCYIKINETDGYVFTIGIKFSEFIGAIHKLPNGILILKGCPINSNFNFNTCLEYVGSQQMKEFIKEDVYNFGDFCWVDYENCENMNMLTDRELSELLFSAHMKRTIDTPFFNSLKNEYLYLSHDDEYWVKVYMKDIKDYKCVIENKIYSALKGRKRVMEHIPDEMVDKLYEIFIGGGVLDFENCHVSSDFTGVNIYQVNNSQPCYDDIHRELDRQRNILSASMSLEYNTKSKKWSLN